MRAVRLHPPAPEDWADRRVVVVVAHPDDEVLGCGALMATLRDARIVHVTDGAPRNGTDARRSGFASPEAYAAARHREALAALALAGLDATRLTRLPFADQAAAADLPAIAHALAPCVAAADIVLTHAYEGGHPDHDAVAYAARAAVRLCGADIAIVEMPFYYGTPEGWARQQFLPRPEGRPTPPETMRVLTPAERALKLRMIAAHATQAETLAAFPPAVERFREAPAHDFAARPHGGPLLYERHGWNLTWPAWQARVEQARDALGPAAP